MPGAAAHAHRPVAVACRGGGAIYEESSMQTLLYFLLAVLMGAVMSVYLPMNSSVSRYLRSPVAANAVFYLVALITTILVLALSGGFRTAQHVKTVPAYLFLAGVMSALIVLGATFLIPRLGARRLFVLQVAGQVLMAIVVSHLGVLESPRDPLTVRKLIGAALLLLGAVVSVV
jgi:transporter family-2 protein